MKFFSHFSALTGKNLYTYRRKLLASIFEILVPLFLIVVLILIKITNKDEPRDDYTNETFTLGMLPELKIPDYSYSMCNYYHSVGGLWGYGLVSNSSLTSFLHHQLLRHPMTQNLTAVFFESNNDLEDYIKSEDYNDNIKLCFAVQVETFTNKEIEISFRSNSSYVFSDKSALMGSYIDVYNFYRTETITEALQESDPDFIFQYLSSGMLQTVNYVTNFALKSEGIEKEMITEVKNMKNTRFKRDSNLLFIKSLIVLFSYMAYMVPMCRMISAVIKEREERMKELLLIMGISNGCYWGTWLFHYIIVYTILSILMAMIIILGLYTKSDFFWVFLVYWLYGLFCVFYSQLISIFFKKAKIAIFVSVIIYLLSFLLGYGLSSDGPTTKTSLCFIPNIGFHLALNTISDLEITNLGVTSKTVGLTIKSMKLTNVFIGYPVAILVIAILALYFENIMPSGYKQKNWDFFFRTCNKNNKVFNNFEIDISVEGEFVENVDSALEAQKRSRQAMMIRGLCKSYGERRILDNINLDIYEGQIFALLGHNGSGKTTTISTIIGSIMPNTGEMIIGDYRLSQDIERIREMIGACLQENILFPVLTPYEHIKVFSIFKRIPIKTITNDFIFDKLAEVKLLEAKDTPSENLSGGQKRKLCLAIALLGDSKIVILDEPTSGMDLNSRRYMWDLLKNNKSERIIILTTHYMEEADILSDRVAMLINGSVRCCGSPLYLKGQFGGGYFLSLLKMHNVSSKFHTEKIMSFMEYNLKDYWNIVHDLQSEVTFQLPFNFIVNCLDFFKELEDNMGVLALRGYSISVTTLEEVFMKVMQLKSEAKFEITERQSFVETFAVSEVTFLKTTEKQTSRRDQLMSILRKRFITSKRDLKTTLIEILCPGFFILFTFAMVNWKFLDSLTEKLSLSSDLYSEKILAYNSFPSSDEFMSACDLESMSLATSKFEYELNPSLDSGLYAGVYFNNLGHDSQYVNFTLYPNQKILHSSAFYYSKLAQCVLIDQGSNLKLKVNNFPFPLTYSQSLVYSLPASFILVTGLGMGFGFIPSSIIILLSHERTTGIKHLHRISGLSILVYWIGNFIWDMVKQLMMVITTISLIFMTDFTMLKGNSNYSMICGLIIAYSFNSTLFSYMLSFLFKSSSSANVNSLLIHLISGCLLPNVLVIILNYKFSRSVLAYFIWFLRFFPNFSLNWGIMKLVNNVYITTISNKKQIPNDLSWEGSGQELFMLWIECVFCIFAIAIAEVIEHRPYICSRKPNVDSALPSVHLIDDDVEAEARRAKQTDPNDVVVNVKSMSKFFSAKGSAKIAVDDLSFNIYRGECFTILGVNGAGKTTTFKILTGTTAPTRGIVHIHGFNIKTEINKVRQSLGYCPQYDVLNDTLTARETLEMYSSFRGIPKIAQRQSVEKVLDLVDLTEHADFVCGHYSGGNKRKLCLGISILGFPELIILDEPTAGMDPESRKKVWKLLNELKVNQCSIILTSHSMDEAENVSDRISIMVGGRLQCLGSPVYIKQRFGDQFELQIKMENPGQIELNEMISVLNYSEKNSILDRDGIINVLNLLKCGNYYRLINQKNSGSALYWTLERKGGVGLEDLLNWVITEQSGDNIVFFLRDNFNEIKVEEHYFTYFKIKIMNNKNISLGSIFHLIEINKFKLKIAGYSLSQTSLDQIFNKFAKIGETSGYKTIPPISTKMTSFLSTEQSDNP